MIEIVAAIGVIIGFAYALRQGKGLRSALVYAFVGGIALPLVYMVVQLAVALIMLLVKVAALVILLALLYMLLRKMLLEGSRGARRPW